MAIDWEGMVGAPTVAVFGQPALYIPATGAPYPVTVVFDEGYTETVLLEGMAPTSDARPVAGVNDAQLAAAVVQGQDRLQVLNTYIIKEARPDKHGITKLMLALTAAYPP